MFRGALSLAHARARSGGRARAAQFGCGVGAILDVQYYANQTLGDACSAALLAGRPCVAAAAPAPVLWVGSASQAGVTVTPPSAAPWSVALAPGACMTANAAAAVPPTDFTALIAFVAAAPSPPAAYTVWSGPGGQALRVDSGGALLYQQGGATLAAGAQPLAAGLPARVAVACSGGACTLSAATQPATYFF